MSIFDRLRPEVTDPQEIRERGLRARQLLEDNVLQEALEDVEVDALRQWRDSANPEVRDGAWATVHALQQVERVLLGYASDAEVQDAASS